tara:strand:+ start:19463 stop:19711 length:249 start_codon:yes stop_codon:yes gene_type:complete
MPDFESYVDVSVEDFFCAMSTKEIDEFIELLVNEERISPMNIIKNQNILDGEWNNICNKLSELRLRLSNEDEKIISDISNKY